MRLVRYGGPGAEVPGVLDGVGVLRDASSLTTDWDGRSLAPDRLAALAPRVAGLPAVPPVASAAWVDTGATTARPLPAALRGC